LFSFSGDAGLLALEQVKRNGLGVGHLDEFESFVVESGDPPLGARQLCGVVVVAE
jgi:hypothetical protein